MTSIDGPASLAPGENESQPSQAESRWAARAEALLSQLSDRFNPILVKEARQALKSKQFLWTFAALLVCGWGWSILGVAMIGPSVYYSSQGPDMFFGYYVILALPLLVVVPFGAFQSLAGERQDGTHELLSITTLSARQIISGKLGSAGLQMLLYFSALSPCLAFTYLLRGIDVSSIAMVLFFTLLASMGLSLLALMAATISRHRHWQAIWSVGLVLGLGWCFFWSLMMVGAWLSESRNMAAQPEFWTGCLAVVCYYLGYFLLLFLTASSLITFQSENRSSGGRVAMLVLYLIHIGWMAGLWFGLSEREALGPMLVFFTGTAFFHWYVLGALMIGESPVMSQRVKRSLPQSFFGRTFLTWLNPGPGTG
ncbi:MAG: hypothetical protein N2C14_04345, partial [Planctomycetales bacterium]